jgi:hypothetical protein
MTVTTSAQPTVPASVRVFAAVCGILAISAITGALTPLGEALLPHAIRSMADSSGPWALITFASIYFARLGPKWSAVLGALSFLIMDVTFYLVFVALGWFYPRHSILFWIGIAIVIGPLVGVCAAWLRSANLTQRAIGVAAPSSILMGEGVFMLVKLPGESTLYAATSLFVGIAMLIGLSAWLLRNRRVIALTAALAATGAFAFYAVYGLIPMVLNKTVA